MPDKVSNATVFHDGFCPLCASEIRHYRNQDSNHELAFVDVSEEDPLLPANLTRQQAMTRFHILSRDGRLLAGASAFAEVWANLPKWHCPLARSCSGVISGMKGIAIRPIPMNPSTPIKAIFPIPM
jgi:predicted DCC family thiol-disulfide oxidoreductase YuxK